MEQNCQRNSNAQSHKIAIGAIGQQQNTPHHNQSAKWQNAAKVSTNTKTEDPANGKDPQSYESNFGTIEIRSFRLVFV